MILSDIETFIAQLEKRLVNLQPALSFAHRAFVIEFAGTPKSGRAPLLRRYDISFLEMALESTFLPSELQFVPFR